MEKYDDIICVSSDDMRSEIKRGLASVGTSTTRIGKLEDVSSAAITAIRRSAEKDNRRIALVPQSSYMRSMYGKKRTASIIIEMATLISGSDKCHLIVIDDTGMFNDAGRKVIENEYGCQLASSLHDIGIEDNNPRNASTQSTVSSLFDDNGENDVPDKKNNSRTRIPGMLDTTPDNIIKSDNDPFTSSDIDDIFSAFDDNANGTKDDDDEHGNLESDANSIFSDDIFDDNNDDIFSTDNDDLFDSSDDFDIFNDILESRTGNKTNNDNDPFSSLSGNPEYTKRDDSDPFSNIKSSDSTSNMLEADHKSNGISLQRILDEYGDDLNDDDFTKLRTMIEPSFDYSLEHDDNIGKNGLLSSFGLGGSSLKGISQVDANMLADSSYIAEETAEHGYYAPPNECQVVSVYSPKGGSGKTTVATMIATQLNWYLNKDLMQRMTTSVNARILMMSFNEFDDLPVQGIGYDSIVSEEEETDGHNVYELLQCVEDADGKPTWDDISQCFVSNERNHVYYLPSLTQKERTMIKHTMTAKDYRDIITACSMFFSFIVIDSPDTFYDSKGDLMTFSFSISDIIVFVIEPDARNTRNLYHLFDAITDDDGETSIPSEKCILVVNKYVSSGNPYMPVAPKGQIKYEKITKSMAKYFARFALIPFTRPVGSGNILFETDEKVKIAAADLTDRVLELIGDNNNRKQKQRHHDINGTGRLGR